ncbi:hypothetical protein LTR74_017617 [Friedmanniomyces endolithicus]|nr:hypothetical protein LTR74_017617 [Friedmanniomyces endolithicus]
MKTRHGECGIHDDALDEWDHLEPYVRSNTEKGEAANHLEPSVRSNTKEDEAADRPTDWQGFGVAARMENAAHGLEEAVAQLQWHHAASVMRIVDAVSKGARNSNTASQLPSFSPTCIPPWAVHAAFEVSESIAWPTLAKYGMTWYERRRNVAS